jgi:dCMP deaminase
MEKELKWINRWFQLVDLAASWSYDKTKVGAVIIPENSDVPLIGWNGFPRKVKDLAERYENRELKYKLIVHAEMNALLNSSHNGINVKNGTLFVSYFPCNECAKSIAQAGIKKIYYKNNDPEFFERWKESIKISKLIFDESEIVYTEHK